MESNDSAHSGVLHKNIRKKTSTPIKLLGVPLSTDFIKNTPPPPPL